MQSRLATMTPSRRRFLRLVLLLGLPVLAVCAGVVVWQQGGRFVSTDNAYVKADVAQIAPEIPGRVTEVAVRDHDTISAGAVLVRLDPEPYRIAPACGQKLSWIRPACRWRPRGPRGVRREASLARSRVRQRISTGKCSGNRNSRRAASCPLPSW